jgi:hypothetical protein
MQMKMEFPGRKSIHVNFLSWQNWRFEVFQLEFGSENWRLFVDILCVHWFIIYS